MGKKTVRRRPVSLIRGQAANGALKSVSLRKYKLLSLVIGYAALAYASICFAQESMPVKAMQPDDYTDRSGQDVVPLQDNVVIRVTNDLVSLSADNTYIRLILKDLTTQSDVKVWISENVKPVQVTLHFDALPMDEALRRLLRGNSYTLVYDGKGDKAAVTGVYVLPPGNVPYANVKRMHENNNITGSQVLRNALKSHSIPDSVKAALLSQDRSNTTEMQQTVTAQRTQVIHKLLEQLEEVGAADPETIRQLRTKYELQKTLGQK